MTGKKKAVGYICGIPVKGTGEVIDKENQRIRIVKAAQEGDMELVAVFEDEEYTRDFMGRPGLRKMLESAEKYDVVLVERVWSLSRQMKTIRPLLEMLDKKNVRIEATSCLWDCVSQQVRHRYAEPLGEKCRREARHIADAKRAKKAA